MRAQFAPWAIQAAVGFLAAAIGTYVAVQVQANSIAWISQILRNHEARIEALEVHVFMDRNRSGAREGELRRLLPFAPEERKLLALKLPGIELARAPLTPLGAREASLSERPARPSRTNCPEIAFQAYLERQRRDGWHAPPASPAACRFAVHGQGTANFNH